MGYRDWHVGMKVVCIGDGMPGYNDCPGDVRIGEVYTIIWVGLTSKGDVSIDLEELPAPETRYLDRGYFASHFRPVQTRATGISVFRAMLVNPPKELAYTVPNRPFE